MVLRLLLIGLVMSLLVVPNVSASERKAGNEMVVFPFSGLLQDENLNTISGVYPLRFALYKSESSRRAVWNERLWVSVDAGRYTVNLGSRKRIPKRLKLENLFIGVSMEGVGEILRTRLMDSAPIQIPEPAPTPPQPPPQRPSKGHSSDIAERAMHAFEADHATNADKIGNLTVSDLKKMFTPGKVKAGSRVKETEPAGGPGGKLYELECPRGYVVTGVRGGEGKYLDSISLICSPLELD